MGFQSYELLNGDATQRSVQKNSFMKGEVRNPTLDYPFLDDQNLESLIRTLEPVLDQSQQYEDDTLGEVVWNSASYRMAEMYWLREAKRLNDVADRPDSPDFLNSAARYQAANEQLYGRPEHETVEKVYGEILAQAREKMLHPTAQHLYDQLVNGVTIYLDNEQVHMPGIGADHPDRLPLASEINQKLGDLKEVIEETFSDARRIVEQYWQEVIVPRDGAQPAFTPEDMKVVFEQVRDFYDPDNEADIGVIINPNSTSLAWDTPSRSVQIGAKRETIEDPNKMFAKVIHEYANHGLRAVNGRKSGVPTLDTGMYSDADEGERSDYLTFEEGFATLCEMAAYDSFDKWDSSHVHRYLTIASAYEGNDFRQIYERTWRAIALMNVEDGAETTDEIIATAQKEAHLATVRALRGTPTRLSGGPVLTFNKDLAYLNGKLDALRYLDEHAGDKQAIIRLFLGKFDPNNHVQNSIVEQYVEAA